MLPKEFRLQREKFNSVFKEATPFYSRYFTLLYQPLQDQKSPQFGIIASLKVGKANKRIKCKRKLRGMILENIGDFPKGNFVFICKSNLAEATAGELRDEFKRFLSKT